MIQPLRQGRVFLSLHGPRGRLDGVPQLILLGPETTRLVVDELRNLDGRGELVEELPGKAVRRNVERLLDLPRDLIDIAGFRVQGRREVNRRVGRVEGAEDRERMLVQLLPLHALGQRDCHPRGGLVARAEYCIAGLEIADLDENRPATIVGRDVEVVLQADDEVDVLADRRAIAGLGGRRRHDAQRNRDEQERTDPPAVQDVTLHTPKLLVVR